MAEKQETHEDIIAEMRRDADADDITPDCILGQKLNYLADRLEAAHKREMSKNVSKNGADFGQLGNAAAMREALEATLNLFWNIHYENRSPQSNQAYAVIKQIKAALAAPPRNCDMPLVVNGPADNNADKAWLVFKRHNPDAYFDVSGLLRCIDWLLATATEKKGGSDEKNNKLREALEKLMKFTCNSCERRLREDDAENEDGQIVSRPCSAIIGARNALAEPVKNCEVGTVEQQGERFAEYCESEVCKRKWCKFRAKVLCIERCALAWAQMPYEEGGEK